MEELKIIVNDIEEGRKIFDRVPRGVQPCWGGLLLDRCLEVIDTVIQIKELSRVIDNPQKWLQAHHLFTEIRKYGLEHPEYQPAPFLLLAEKIAKITYNATNPSAPFDANSGWFIPKLALLTTFSLAEIESECPYVIASSLFMYDRQPELRELVQMPNDFSIYRRIDDILWNDWSPIGFKGSLPRDEYQSYVPGVFQLYKSGCAVKHLAEHLFRIETETMGLSHRHIESCFSVAKKIMAISPPNESGDAS